QDGGRPEAAAHAWTLWRAHAAPGARPRRSDTAGGENGERSPGGAAAGPAGAGDGRYGVRLRGQVRRGGPHPRTASDGTAPAAEEDMGRRSAAPEQVRRARDRPEASGRSDGGRYSPDSRRNRRYLRGQPRVGVAVRVLRVGPDARTSPEV